MSQKILTISKKISMILAIFAVVGMGLVFILFSDLYLGATSYSLFLAIFFPLVSTVFFVLAESFRHKKSIFILFKVLAFVFSVAFIVYIFYFMSTSIYTDTKTFLKLTRDYGGKHVSFLDSVKFADGIDIPFNKSIVFIPMIVISIIGSLAVAVNTVTNIILGID